ncbi:unnamed protein product [Lactuca virosa]|uniref:Uncharacterized protein n=1 Tax=Lactuca virosa TaxID=75947 RepID=A0AAU9MFX2_9ASTR|nr:unnamed protein product [Lactuca virosa]
MKQSRKAAKVAYQGLKELIKFGKFAEVEDTPAASSINVEVAEEHVAPKPKFQFAFEEIEQSILIPEEDVAVTPPIVTERESDIMVQSASPTPEQMDALITELQRTARKPPQTVHVDTEPPSGSDLKTQPTLYSQGSEREEIQGRENVEENGIPSEGAQASRSSFETPGLDISKCKSKLPDSKLVDVVLLQNRVFDLEQSSAEKDLIIGKQYIRIRENITASGSGPTDPASQSSSERATRPAPDANLDTFLSSGPVIAQERREKQIRVKQLKGKMLVMKHSDQNAPAGEFRSSSQTVSDLAPQQPALRVSSGLRSDAEGKALFSSGLRSDVVSGLRSDAEGKALFSSRLRSDAVSGLRSDAEGKALVSFGLQSDAVSRLRSDAEGKALVSSGLRSDAVGKAQ